MRCSWADRSEQERIYHDTEWGVVLHDDRRLFEHLTLRGAQAGLSFRTVLVKREGYRAAFHDYDVARIAAMTDTEVDALLLDRSVIRNRLKLHSVRTNARAMLRLALAGESLAGLLWSVADDKEDMVGPGLPVAPIAPGASNAPNAPNASNALGAWRAPGELPVRTRASDELSAQLTRRGFRFAGTAICHSLMQTAGAVEAHVEGCPFRR